MPARKTPLLDAQEQRFRQARQELLQLDYFLKGTVLKRMMKCGRPQCACHRDPAKRHGPYFEWTYKVKGKTVNVKLSSQAAPLYLAATKPLLSKTGKNLAARVANGSFACPELEF
jgi:hypothetical protein